MSTKFIASQTKTALRRRRQRGEVIVEAAVIFVPFFAIFFALIDFSMGLFLKNTMQFAVRQGVRYAVTSQVMQNPNGTNMGQDDSIKQRVKQYSMGFLDYLAPGHVNGTDYIHVDYYLPDGTPVSGNGSNVGGNIVKVSAQSLSWAWMIPLLRSSAPFNFTVGSADIVEATPNGGAPGR